MDNGLHKSYADLVVLETTYVILHYFIISIFFSLEVCNSVKSIYYVSIRLSISKITSQCLWCFNNICHGVCLLQIVSTYTCLTGCLLQNYAGANFNPDLCLG